jgi:hypothetical protein
MEGNGVGTAPAAALPLKLDQRGQESVL